MPTYAHITTPANSKDFKGGYKDTFYFAPLADFLALQEPGAVVAVGDSLKITTAHTFTAPKGFFTWETKTQTATITGETTGEPGAQVMKWTAKFQILGDSASNQEQVEALLNAKMIVLLKDSKCAAGEYIQLGDDCTQPSFTATFNGATTAEGSKIYEVTATITGSKYFYSGAVTESAV